MLFQQADLNSEKTSDDWGDGSAAKHLLGKHEAQFPEPKSKNWAWWCALTISMLMKNYDLEV